MQIGADGNAVESRVESSRAQYRSACADATLSTDVLTINKRVERVSNEQQQQQQPVQCSSLFLLLLLVRRRDPFGSWA